jgi:hypothetical protein
VLAKNNVWSLIQGKFLWAHVLKDKYFPQENIVDWIIKPNKYNLNGSILWKEILSAFPIIGNWLI